MASTAVTGTRTSTTEPPNRPEKLISSLVILSLSVADQLTQIANRRGWLQSAGMLTDLGDGTVRTSEAGLALLAELALHDPATAPVATSAVETSDADRDVTLAPPPTDDDVRQLVDEVMAASTDSANPDRFERAVRAAFDFLAHPSCLGIVDPEFKTVDLILDLVKRADGKAAIVDLDTIAARASKG